MLRRMLACGAVALAVVGVASGVSAVAAEAQPPVNASTTRPSSLPQAGTRSPAGTLGDSSSLAALRAQRPSASRTIGADAAAADAAGNVTATATGDADAVAAQARRLGGRALAATGRVTSVVIDKDKVAALGRAAGVADVSVVPRAVPQALPPSEGVAASNASGWQTAGKAGAGQTVAVVDVGFADYQSQLPANTTLANEECRDDNGASTVGDDDHGTAVAHIVHDMAPSATLRLYCVYTPVGLQQAAADIAARGITVASMSLGFPGDSRGDGTGDVSGVNISAAGVVAASRRNDGVLWVVAAGNEAADHWSGQLTDTDNDTYVDIDGPYNDSTGHFEDDVFFVVGGSPAAPAVAQIDAQWDSWPVTNQAVSLVVTGFQCTHDYDDQGCGAKPITLDSDGNPRPTTSGGPEAIRIPQSPGTRPYLGIAMNNPSEFEQFWRVQLVVPRGGYATTRYDLTYNGAVSGPSVNACVATNPNTGACTGISPTSYQGSLASPASSPYALAVGAADVGADGVRRGTLEQFSSQGPTIDGRTKPEITGWDGVSSPQYGDPTTPTDEDGDGFYGTSAATPHVAGAAALIKAADPNLDAAGLQRALTDRASSGTGANIKAVAISPPSNGFGAGLLTLGKPPTSATELEVAGARYTPITSTRLLDTRPQYGGAGKVGEGGTVVVPLSASTPGDATAVAINLTGVDASAGATYLTAYPGSVAPATSNLNLARGVDPTAATFAVVRIDRSTGAPTITVRNNLGTVDVVVDELGYFGTGSETGLLTTLPTPNRVLDTRTTTGNHKGTIPSRGSAQVSPGVPAGATAALVNLTVAIPPPAGYVTASAACPAAGTVPTTSLLNYASRDRSNLAIVPLDANGKFCLSNDGGAVNAIVDVVGYMSPTNGSLFYALPSAQRIIDTRYGNGGNGNGASSAPLGEDAGAPFTGSNVGTVPAAASALLTNVVEASNTRGGYLALLPGSGRPTGEGSTVGFSPGRIVANASVVGLSGRTFSVYNKVGTVQFATDVAGYFAPAPK